MEEKREVVLAEISPAVLLRTTCVELIYLIILSIGHPYVIYWIFVGTHEWSPRQVMLALMIFVFVPYVLYAAAQVLILVSSYLGLRPARLSLRDNKLVFLSEIYASGRIEHPEDLNVGLDLRWRQRVVMVGSRYLMPVEALPMQLSELRKRLATLL